jgi:glutamyl-tRNA reductase
MIVEASVTGIFRTILIIIGTLALLRFLGRIMIAKRNLEEERSIFKAQRKQEKELEKIKKRFGKTDIVNDNSNSNHIKINPDKVEDVDFEEIP